MNFDSVAHLYKWRIDVQVSNAFCYEYTLHWVIYKNESQINQAGNGLIFLYLPKVFEVQLSCLMS